MPLMQERLPLGIRLGRMLGKLAALAVVACIASCTTYVWTIESRRAPEPPLVAGVPMNDNFVPLDKQAFPARLATRFPAGSPEANLVHELWQEGFRPFTDLKANERKATWETNTNQLNVCVTDAVVTWSADDGGRLTSVTGYEAHTCL